MHGKGALAGSCIRIAVALLACPLALGAEDELRQFEIATNRKGCESIPELARYRDMRRDCNTKQEHKEATCDSQELRRSCAQLDPKKDQKAIETAIKFGELCVGHRKDLMAFYEKTVIDALAKDKDDAVPSGKAAEFDRLRDRLIQIQRDSIQEHRGALRDAEQALERCRNKQGKP